MRSEGWLDESSTAVPPLGRSLAVPSRPVATERVRPVMLGEPGDFEMVLVL